MQKRPSRTSSGRYWLWAASTVAVVLIALLIVATIWFGIPGAVVIMGLAFVVFWQILKIWEAGKLPLSPKLSPNRTIPYYQPSHQSSQQPPSSPSYEQGYQEHSSSGSGRSYMNAGLKDVSPSLYEEQPQAQYPEQMPPMG